MVNHMFTDRIGNEDDQPFLIRDPGYLMGDASSDDTVESRPFQTHVH